MDKSKTPHHDCRSCRYLTLCRGVLDLSVIQSPDPNTTVIFKTFSSLQVPGGTYAALWAAQVGALSDPLTPASSYTADLPVAAGPSSAADLIKVLSNAMAATSPFK
jgi:hypothetical protein